MLTTSFPLMEGDYSGIFILRLCKALVSEGVKVDVVAPMADGGQSHAERDGYRIYRFTYFFPKRWQRLAYGPGGIPRNVSRNPWLLLQIPFFLLAFLSKTHRVMKGTDVIHAHWIPVGLVAWGIGALRGVPFIITLRGSDALYARRNNFFSSFSLWILRRAAAVTTVNEELRGWLITHGFPEDRVVFIRNGVALASERRNRGASPLYRFLFVGNLILEKGVRDLIDAFSRVIRSEREVRLTLIGEGAERATLEREVKKNGVDTFMEFVGIKPPEEIHAWMSRSDCLVLPSFSEGTPNVVLEAMACELPVIASDLPGIREVVRDRVTGLLSKPHDVEDLAQKLLEVVRDRSLAKQMGKKGREAIVEMGLDWRQVAGRYREVYQRACAGSRESSI